MDSELARSAIATVTYDLSDVSCSRLCDPSGKWKKKTSSCVRTKMHQESFLFSKYKLQCIFVVCAVGTTAILVLASHFSSNDVLALVELSPTKELPLDKNTASNTFSILVPSNWKRGSSLKVSIPGKGVVSINVPSAVKRGETMYFQIAGISSAKKLATRSTALSDRLTSYDSMLSFERRIRESMGRIRHTWKDTPKALKQARRWMVKAGAMLAEEAAEAAAAEEEGPDADFIPWANASTHPGWNPANPNGFGAGPPGPDDVNSRPGYTFALNGEDLSVADQGPGYYQPVDPEHWKSYLQIIHNDCASVPGQPWIDHSNCAKLVRRSHVYPNDDPWRFSGAFGWNPPFPNVANATNAPGAVAPDANEYWNYGDDDSLASAASWNGKEYVPPPPPPPPPPA